MWNPGALSGATRRMEMTMRLVAEHDYVPECESKRGDLLSLGWSGLGKLVQIESLSLMGAHFEEVAAAEVDTVPPLDSSHDLGSDLNTDTDSLDGFGRGDAA